MPADTPEYSTLMTRRIQRILLVCNNYDSYVLEEDGHIEVCITREFSELNLTNPPKIERVKSTIDALALLEKGEHYDLVITMYNVGKVDVFEFSKRAKAMDADTPIVLLTSYSKEIYRRIEEGRGTGCIDYVFCWNNSTDLLMAIVKLLEDKLNADHDILDTGVQAILLVEDSVRYYSTYLPMLYRIILQQNNESIKEALNEQQQIMRKRARPKILMATNYDDAVELYSRYKDNLLGVISDIGFVLHRGDRPQDEKLDAGVDLCNLIRSITPKMPILLQSSQESMRSVARDLGVGFVVKTSHLLHAEISEYISKEFAFGDFVLTNDEGEEIARAQNLLELEKMIRTLPDDELKDLAATNYMSKWLKARGLFSLSTTFAGMSVEQDGSIQAHRKALVHVVKDYRINQGLGVIAQFDPSTYNNAIWFSRLGNGSMGGKARGLAFMNRILQQHRMYDKWEDVRVLIPRTLVITTEYFDRFIEENGLKYVIKTELPDEELLAEFIASTLPSDLLESLRAFIHTVRKPLAIRSSSLLEDSYYQPFAGVYSTYMIPCTENEDQQLRLIAKAIKSVYASVYYAASRSYITATGNVLSEEKMGIILQEICGSEDSGYFFPTFSGVARSLNFYPIGHEEAEDGIVKVAFGLGKAVVDGDMSLRFSPKYPRHVLQTSTPELTMTDTQQAMYALDMRPDKFKVSVDDGVNIARIPITDCEHFRNLKYVASTFDMENQMIVDSTFPQGPRFITFAQILKYTSFPLAEIMQELLEVSSREVDTYVEIEFAANMDKPSGRRKVLNVLQIRPISVDSRNSVVDWTTIDSSKALIRSSCALGTGWIRNIKDIIYMRADRFDVMKTREMAKEITALNHRMREQKRQYVLIGYGRWGSSIPTLGVPVQWSNISDARVIVEAGLDGFHVDPSQGTHFFQNLTSFNAGYINVDALARSDDFYDTAALDAMPAVEETEYFRHIELEKELTICIDGRGNKALIKL